MSLSQEGAFGIARGLKSEHGENVEYDRALIEFLSDAFGGTRAQVSVRLGIEHCHNCSANTPGHDMCRECGAQWEDAK